MVRWEWNMVKVALELGSHSNRHARQRCFPEHCQACEGWCVWTLSFLYCSGMVCQAMTRWQNLGLQFGARPSSARGRAHFWGGDGGVYRKKAAVAYYCGNLSFTDFLLTLIRIYYFFIIYFIFYCRTNSYCFIRLLN